MAEESGEDKRLLALYEKEALNFGVSLDVLGAEFVDLADECFALYYWLANRDADIERPEREETSVTHFIVAAGQNLYSAVLSVMRAHGSDAAFFTRRAVESAAFLLAMRDDPASFKTWLDATDGEDQARIYRRRFKAIVVLPKDSPNVHRRFLREVFERCSELAHPTMRSFAGRLHPITTDEGIKTAVFRFFESSDTFQAGRAFLWMLHAHEGILQALTESYADVLSLGATDWSGRLEAWARKREDLRQRWERDGGTHEGTGRTGK